jgi:hypothetical protein
VITSCQISIGKCDLCNGLGRFNGKKCPTCEGFGFWEFVVDDNEGAVRFLNDMTAEVSERSKQICGGRIHSVPLENFEQMLTVLNANVTEAAYNRIHEAASKRWGWAWVHGVRFGIALCKLNNVDYSIYAFGLIQLVWHWLEHENQDKVQAFYPSVEESSKKVDTAIDSTDISAL